MSMFFNIAIVGDPMVDVYHIGHTVLKTPQRFVEVEERRFLGGAANVNENLNALIHSDDKIQTTPSYMKDSATWIQLHRFVNQTDNATYQINSEWIHSHDQDPDVYADDIEESIRYLDGWLPQEGPNGLILADYNRGYASKPIPDELFDLLRAKNLFEFIIVDSRRATYNEQWLELAKTKILHATDGEIWFHKINKFDYTFRTRGPGDIRILTPRGNLVASLPVPEDTPIVDTTGAGDTFVAGLAYYLASHPNEQWDSSFMIKAAGYAIPLCQQVIQHLGPATVRSTS